MIVDIAGTRIDWASISQWCARVMEEGGKLRPSSEHYGRLSDLYRSLTVQRVRRSTDRPGIERVARMFDLGRRNPVPAYHGLASVLSRAEMGTMLVELRNRQRALVSGRAFAPRTKGPALSPHVSPMRPSSAWSRCTLTWRSSIVCGPNASCAPTRPDPADRSSRRRTYGQTPKVARI